MNRDRLLSLLRKLEHSEGDPTQGKWCPKCGMADAFQDGHEADCELKAAIDWLEQMPDGVSLRCSDWWKRVSAWTEA